MKQITYAEADKLMDGNIQEILVSCLIKAGRPLTYCELVEMSRYGKSQIYSVVKLFKDNDIVFIRKIAPKKRVIAFTESYRKKRGLKYD